MFGWRRPTKSTKSSTAHHDLIVENISSFSYLIGLTFLLYVFIDNYSPEHNKTALGTILQCCDTITA